MNDSIWGDNQITPIPSHSIMVIILINTNTIPLFPDEFQIRYVVGMETDHADHSNTILLATAPLFLHDQGHYLAGQIIKLFQDELWFNTFHLLAPEKALCNLPSQKGDGQMYSFVSARYIGYMMISLCHMTTNVRYFYFTNKLGLI